MFPTPAVPKLRGSREPPPAEPALGKVLGFLKTFSLPDPRPLVHWPNEPLHHTRSGVLSHLKCPC